VGRWPRPFLGRHHHEQQRQRRHEPREHIRSDTTTIMNGSANVNTDIATVYDSAKPMQPSAGGIANGYNPGWTYITGSVPSNCRVQSATNAANTSPGGRPGSGRQDHHLRFEASRAGVDCMRPARDVRTTSRSLHQSPYITAPSKTAPPNDNSPKADTIKNDTANTKRRGQGSVPFERRCPDAKQTQRLTEAHPNSRYHPAVGTGEAMAIWALSTSTATFGDLLCPLRTSSCEYWREPCIK